MLDHPLPWTKTRQVNKLLGPAAAAATTGSRALEAEATVDDPVRDNVIRGRFARCDEPLAVVPSAVNR